MTRSRSLLRAEPPLASISAARRSRVTFWRAVTLTLACATLVSCTSPSGPEKSAPKTSPSTQAAKPSAAGETFPKTSPSLALSKAKKAPDAPPGPLGQADLDPENDRVVAPPDAIADCHARLKNLGLEFTPSELPLKPPSGGTGSCGAYDAVIVKKTKSGLSFRPPALVTCRLALAIADLDELVVELAKKHLDAKVKSVNQAGTYSCRKMKRFDLVSEHSYGNAIDIVGFTLTTGKKLTVLSDFGALDAPPQTKEARFLRALSEQAFDRNIVSVSLGPYWDALHKDHFHLDLAHYRVDGSRR